MTLTQLDHLNRIKTHLENLLANAEKRTEGKWEVKYREQFLSNYSSLITYKPLLTCEGYTLFEGYDTDEKKAEDFDFIASCAGNAEAGWRSTLAAITSAQRYIERSQSIGDHCGIECANGVINSILTAWPIESLKL